MDEISLDGRIAIKQKEIQVEKDPNKKAELNNDLEILNIRKQIEQLRSRISIKQKRS